MKVAIVAPPYPLEECPAPPLGITYVAAAFEASGADVRIWDYVVSRYSKEKLQIELERFKPDVVGATSVTMNFHAAADIIKSVKEYDPSIITIMGGPHVTFDAANTLARNPEVDLIVMGEGEETITELMSISMDERQWPDVRGIAFRHDGRIADTGARDFIKEIDSIPMPARHLLSHSRYQALGYPVSIITGRGCPHNCIFCLGRKMVGKKVRRRRASLIADEIENILSYGWTRINFADDLFTSSKQKVRDVCGEIKKRGLKFTWSAFGRVDSVDMEILRLMRDVGCDSISFGVESGNSEMLKRIRKGITLEKVRHAVQMCRAADIIAHASFMAGLPGESPESLKETEEFASSLNILYGYHFLAPFPGTTLREEIGRYDLEILTQDWNRYDANSAIVKTSSLSPEEIERFVAEYDKKIDMFWKEMVYGYRNGTNTPEDDLKVEGYFKAQLVYKILSEDIIESCGTFPVKAFNSDAIGPEKEEIQYLSKRIMEKIKMERPIIEKTLTYLVNSGLLRMNRLDGYVVCDWSENKRAGI
jgi:radical SAM superfamily enzyme YgiQ (UPF0313 family)